MVFDLYTVCGFLGAIVLMGAYFSNLRGWLESQNWGFPAANAAGSAMILVSLYKQWNLPSVVIECFWAAISLYGLLRNLRRSAQGSVPTDSNGS